MISSATKTFPASPGAVTPYQDVSQDVAKNVVPFRRSGNKQRDTRLNVYLDGKHIAFALFRAPIARLLQRSIILALLLS
jgi:hypothetical protein